jgi:preprotein translocase subunit SecD
VRRSLWGSLLGIVGIAVVALGGTLAAGNHPSLGLDLQGGASVVLQPEHKVDSGVLNQAIKIIRSRVDALGVAEPDISRQGNSIVVQLPGVKNRSRALQIVGQTAQLYFRGVVRPAVLPTLTTGTVPAAGGDKTTPPLQDDPTKQVVLPEIPGGSKKVSDRLVLGPAEMTGRALSGAQPAVDPNTGAWRVDMNFTSTGKKEFQALARKYANQRVAIDLDGVVKSAPTINPLLANNFNGSAQITGNFKEREARDLALVLRYGSLPVKLKQATVQTVSASLGKDSLHAGIVAGLLGLGLVALYMILYYRALGLVVLVGLSVSGALLYAIISELSQTRGLALSLSGAVGIIVSVGVTVDSYVVYFERLKDEIRSGKTVRSSVDRGFARAFRTILAADAVSFIGAMLLYLLTVGSVRGFAFFLGLSTLLDVFTAYFFTRPMVVLLGRNRIFTEAKWLGVARGLAVHAAGGTG